MYPIIFYTLDSILHHASVRTVLLLFILIRMDFLKSKVKFYVGIENVGGDMHVSVPKGDAIMIKVSYLTNYLTLESRWAWLKKKRQIKAKNVIVCLFNFFMFKTAGYMS